jgi:predicted Zn-dependent protease
MLLGSQIAMASRAAGADTVLRTRSEQLQTWVAEHPQDAAVWLVLSQVWNRLGHPLRSVRSEAEARYAIGDLTGAIDRLRAGQSLVRAGGKIDFIEASVIDSRLRDIEAQRRSEWAERDEQRRGGG